ncbi:MAG TPA: pyridoxal 5'-phosphate synthase glutaminase subunit PdxT [Methylomirabilota bacterium]|jgi:pyridoxal 5'-phosphate synthase pdxT subunit|nr:pyridoxal 5'-phosphate synthase glutaminase subunit PdxT [Methylomirabilota bacterium]
MKIGVLALQGDFAMHAKALSRCHSDDGSPVEVIEVRKPEQLEGLDGLIMPGGESTTLLKLMELWGFVPALEKFHATGRPIFGTCAGLILLAREVTSPAQFSLGFIDVGVERNAYGRQRESFEAHGSIETDGRPAPVEMVFIRAPRIRRLGAGVQTLARHGDEAVMARQGSVLVATFHPELTDDPTVHDYFCRMVAEARRR